VLKHLLGYPSSELVPAIVRICFINLNKMIENPFHMCEFNGTVHHRRVDLR
jgi:hypothetical protein